MPRQFRCLSYNAWKSINSIVYFTVLRSKNGSLCHLALTSVTTKQKIPVNIEKYCTLATSNVLRLRSRYMYIINRLLFPPSGVSSHLQYFQDFDFSFVYYAHSKFKIYQKTTCAFLQSRAIKPTPYFSCKIALKFTAIWQTIPNCALNSENIKVYFSSKIEQKLFKVYKRIDIRHPCS